MPDKPEQRESQACANPHWNRYRLGPHLGGRIKELPRIGTKPQLLSGTAYFVVNDIRESLPKDNVTLVPGADVLWSPDKKITGKSRPHNTISSLRRARTTA